VGAALLFADGSVVTGCNVENASYGLSLCAETVACGNAAHAGQRGGLWPWPWRAARKAPRAIRSPRAAAAARCSTNRPRWAAPIRW
jgi:hypothetical protein